jgi:hypothetical protein
MNKNSVLPILTMSLLSLVGASLMVGCGGSSSTSTAGNNTITQSGNNIAAMAVNSGPPELQALGGAVNTGFITMSMCVPGTSTCQSVNFASVDTGSTGIRILASKLSISLPAETDSSGNTLAECNQFVDGYTWGPLRFADISIDGTNEKATSVPIQIVDDTNSFTAAPGSCVASSVGSDNSVAGLGAYAIIGVGNFRQDCGLGCAQPLGSGNNPGLYYVCASGNCGQTIVSVAHQAQNPVSLFPADNNGTIVELPSIATTGVASVSGSLVFGIGTQSNNGLGSATEVMLDGIGGFTTYYGPGKNAYPESFIDSGSNGVFFLDTSLDGIPACTSNSSFYCPASTLNLSATNQGLSGASSVVNFSVANAESLSSTSFAFNDLAGTNNNPPAFDFGMPFFFGRNVYTGIESVSNGQPTDTGQFVAY